jgi:hypothetical protein
MFGFLMLIGLLVGFLLPVIISNTVGILALQQSPSDSFDRAHRILHGMAEAGPEDGAGLTILMDASTTTATTTTVKRKVLSLREENEMLKMKPWPQRGTPIPSKHRVDYSESSSESDSSEEVMHARSRVNEREMPQMPQQQRRFAPAPKPRGNQGMRQPYGDVDLYLDEKLVTMKGASTPTTPTPTVVRRTNANDDDVPELTRESPLASAANNPDAYV